MSRLASKPCVHCHSPAPFPLIHPPSLHHPFVRTIIRASLTVCIYIYMYVCVYMYIYICIYGSYTGIIRVLYSWGLSLAVASVCVLARYARVQGCVRVALCACSQILCRPRFSSLAWWRARCTALRDAGAHVGGNSARHDS